MMLVCDAERQAIKTVIQLGERWGYGNLIAHLQAGWARMLVKEHGLSEAAATEFASSGHGYPIAMHEDIVLRGFWDETGARYFVTAPAEPITVERT